MNETMSPIPRWTRVYRDGTVEWYRASRPTNLIGFRGYGAKREGCAAPGRRRRAVRITAGDLSRSLNASAMFKAAPVVSVEGVGDEQDLFGRSHRGSAPPPS